MNPNNIFGRQQGAFQTPSNVSQNNGLFQPQQSGSTSNLGFGEKSPFGPPSAFSQSSVFAQGSAQTSGFGQTSSFGQSPSFGQSSGFGQTSSFSSTSQAPAFGQPALSQATLGFGPPPPSSGQSQAPAFGQVQAFGQTSGFVQTTGFGQTTSGFGISSNNSQLPSNSNNAGGSQPSFVQPSAFATTSSSVSGQSNTLTGAFGTNFSFKPPNETVFKPIFSVSSVPPSVQADSAPESFGASKPVAGGSGSTGVPLFTGVKPSTLGFSFSQPGVVPSALVTSASMSQTTGGMIGTNTPQFTFSQPANPPSSSSIVTATQSTSISSSPSAFSFSAKVVQPQTVFGPPSFAFSVSKPQENPEVRIEVSSGDAPFGNLGKGMKRKEEPCDPNASQGKSNKAEEEPGEFVGPRHPSKRPLIRSRVAAGGLFKNALSDVMKTSVNKREERTIERAPGERPDPPVPDLNVPPRPQAPIRHVLEKEERPGNFVFVFFFCFV